MECERILLRAPPRRYLSLNFTNLPRKAAKRSGKAQQTPGLLDFLPFYPLLSFLPSQMTATAQQPTKAQPVHLATPAAAPNAPVPTAAGDPQAQLEADKRAVYR